MNPVPKNKTGGVVTSTVLAVGGLIIAVIVILVIVSTLTGAGLFDSQRENYATINYSDSVLTLINDTGVPFGNFSIYGKNTASCDITGAYVVNDTMCIGNCPVLTTDYVTNNSATNGDCRIAFAPAGNTTINQSVWVLNWTVSIYGNEENAVVNMSGNFSEGIDNISSKIPTILLIVAVVFLFGALVLLVRNANAMNIGGGGSL